MFELLVSIVDSIEKIRLDEFIVGVEFKALIEETVVDFGWNTHQSNGFATNLAHNGFSLWTRIFCHSSGQILGRNQVCDKEFAKLTGEDLRLFVENRCQIVVIFFFGHSYLHLLNWVVLRWVEKLRFVTYPDQTFEDLPVGTFELQKVASDHFVRALEILENFNFASFHEENSVKLGLNRVQILQESFSHLLNILMVGFWDTEEIEPQGVTTAQVNTFQIVSLSNPILPEIKMFIIILTCQPNRKIIKTRGSNDILTLVKNGKWNEGAE